MTKFRLEVGDSMCLGSPASGMFRPCSGCEREIAIQWTLKDIVTDGTYLWVVNDSKPSYNKFQYTIGGTYVGSWVLKQPLAPTALH